MYSEQACERRDKFLKEIAEATARTVREANERSFDHALTLAWQAGYEACLDDHDLKATIIKDDKEEEK